MQLHFRLLGSAVPLDYLFMVLPEPPVTIRLARRLLLPFFAWFHILPVLLHILKKDGWDLDLFEAGLRAALAGALLQIIAIGEQLIQAVEVVQGMCIVPSPGLALPSFHFYNSSSIDGSH